MTVSEQCEKKLLAVKQEEKSGKIYDSFSLSLPKVASKSKFNSISKFCFINLNAKRKANRCKYMSLASLFLFVGKALHDVTKKGCV